MLAFRRRFDSGLDVEFGDAGGEPLLTVHEPAEFEVVGKNPIRRAVAVAEELASVRPLALLHVIEIRADIL